VRRDLRVLLRMCAEELSGLQEREVEAGSESEEEDDEGKL